jgi:hypothetical protein
LGLVGADDHLKHQIIEHQRDGPPSHHTDTLQLDYCTVCVSCTAVLWRAHLVDNTGRTDFTFSYYFFFYEIVEKENNSDEKPKAQSWEGKDVEPGRGNK